LCLSQYKYTTFFEILLFKEKKMKKVLITESQLRAMVRKMLMEQVPMGSTPVGSTGFQQPQGQQKDQAIETAMLTALQKDTALMGRLKGVTNFSQADSLIKAVLSLTKIPQTQIKSGLSNLSRMGVQTQAKG
jgi:hypothetical protein